MALQMPLWTANANEMSLYDAVSWWLACRLELFPISTTLTHHHKVQNLYSYHFFDWLSRERERGINIEFCTVVKLTEVKRGERKKPVRSEQTMSKWQHRCSFRGNESALAWLQISLNKTVCHAVRMLWNSEYLCAIFHYAWSSCSCSKSEVYIKYSQCSGYSMSFLSSLRYGVWFVYIVVFDLWNTDRLKSLPHIYTHTQRQTLL